MQQIDGQNFLTFNENNKGYDFKEENEELKQKISQKLQEANDANLWLESSKSTEEIDLSVLTDFEFLRAIAASISTHEISEGRQVITEALKTDKDKVGEHTDER